MSYMTACLPVTAVVIVSLQVTNEAGQPMQIVLDKQGDRKTSKEESVALRTHSHSQTRSRRRAVVVELAMEE